MTTTVSSTPLPVPSDELLTSFNKTIFPLQIVLEDQNETDYPYVISYVITDASKKLPGLFGAAVGGHTLFRMVDLWMRTAGYKFGYNDTVSDRFAIAFDDFEYSKKIANEMFVWMKEYSLKTR
jgi:hypothetical protein